MLPGKITIRIICTLSYSMVLALFKLKCVSVNHNENSLNNHGLDWKKYIFKGIMGLPMTAG